MAFNKRQYDNDYVKKNYKRHSVLLKPDLDRNIAVYLEWNMLSFNEFAQRAFEYYLQHKEHENADK